MNWEEVYQGAIRLGFAFEKCTWIPDGYQEDEDGNDTRKLITKPVSMLKVTFPSDYPHPFSMIDVDGVKGLQFAINEYLNRDKIAEDTRRRSGEVEAALKSWAALLN